MLRSPVCFCVLQSGHFCSTKALEGGPISGDDDGSDGGGDDGDDHDHEDQVVS